MISIPETAFANCNTAADLYQIMVQHRTLNNLTPKGHELLKHLAQLVDSGKMRDNSIKLFSEHIEKALNISADFLYNELLYFHKYFFLRLSFDSKKQSFIYSTVGIVQSVQWNVNQSTYIVRLDPEWLACLGPKAPRSENHDQ